jgi:hypothetical protein
MTAQTRTAPSHWPAARVRPCITWGECSGKPDRRDFPNAAAAQTAAVTYANARNRLNTTESFLAQTRRGRKTA